MSRNNVRLIGALLILICFGFGYAARGFYERRSEEDRATAFVDMFRTYCLSYAKSGHYPLLTGLVKREAADEIFHVDNVSLLAIKLTTNRCTVTDILLPMSQQERAEVAKLVRQVAVRDFPGLQRRSNFGWEAWQEYALWGSDHPVGDERKWGLLFMRWSDDPKEGETLLNVGGPFGDAYPFGAGT